MAGQSPLRAAVLGASGYAGGELVRLLSAHPFVELTFLGAKDSAGKSLGEVHPHLAGLGGELQPIEIGSVIEAADVVFCALPHGASSELAPSFLERGLRVIDLGGDFRLPASAYSEW